MADQYSDPPDLELLLVHFRGNVEQIRKLLKENEDFQEVCEHYSLARAALDKFTGSPEGGRDVEIADYQKLVPELEQEIRNFIQNATGIMKPPPEKHNKIT